VFSDQFRRRLSLGKYTRWASDLSEQELEAVLWAIGEYGVRAGEILACLDRHRDEFPPAHGFPRARLALAQIAQMVEGTRYEPPAVQEQVRAAIERWRAESIDPPG
jgi:hypothetical protein